MMCSRCGKQQAVVHCLQKMDALGSFLELDLCDDCWELFQDKFQKLQQTFTNMESVLKEAEDIMESQKENVSKVKICNKCNTTIDDLLNSHKLGCQNCYQVFKEELDGVMKVLHGSDKHIGKKLNQSMDKYIKKEENKEDNKQKIAKMQKDLDRAIKYEEYEKAAKIRDKMKELKQI